MKKNLRNGILASIALLSIIALLILNQRRWKIHYKQQVLIQERIRAEERAAEAQRNIGIFKQKVIEKENLIKNLKNTKSQEKDREILREKLFDYALITEEEWLKFKDDFIEAYPSFLPNLRKVLPAPTPAEERLACLVSLNLTNTQIAGMLGIGTASVARSKRRLKSRIDPPEDRPLEEYIRNLH